MKRLRRRLRYAPGAVYRSPLRAQFGWCLSPGQAPSALKDGTRRHSRERTHRSAPTPFAGIRRHSRERTHRSAPTPFAGKRRQAPALARVGVSPPRSGRSAKLTCPATGTTSWPNAAAAPLRPSTSSDFFIRLDQIARRWGEDSRLIHGPMDWTTGTLGTLENDSLDALDSWGRLDALEALGRLGLAPR